MALRTSRESRMLSPSQVPLLDREATSMAGVLERCHSGGSTFERQSSAFYPLSSIHGVDVAEEEHEGMLDFLSKKALRNFSAAVLCSFLGITSGVSLGAIIFPSSPEYPNTEFKIVGMQLGLVSMVISNWCLYAKSSFYFGVAGGMVAPVIAMSSSFFRLLGAEQAVTILIALPMITTINGILIFFAARLPINQLVKGIPYVVFGGFMAGTGAMCIQAGFQIVCPSCCSSLAELLSEEVAPHWLTPMLLSISVFTAQQMGVPCSDLLLSLALLASTCLFFTWWCWMRGESLKAAREEAWLFHMDFPDGLDFYKVWSLQDFSKFDWNLFCGSALPTAVLNCFSLSLLNIVEDIYGVSESRKMHVDIENELKLAGVMNVLCGLAGGMPANLVMSYSLTAHRSGASSRQFLLFLCVLGSAIFVVGDYIIAVMPKFVPAAALMWLGLVLCWEWVCKGVWRLSLQDYSIIWFMIFLNLFLGVEVMIFGGLVATLVQLARRLASMDVIAYSTTTRTERSNRLYPIGEGSVFEEYGTAVMILHLSNGLLFFGSAFQIKEQVEARLDQEPKLMFLLLDLTGIVDAEVSGVKVLQDVMGLGVSNNFQVVFAGLPKTVKAQFKKLGMSRQQIEMAKFFTGLQDALNFVQESLICEFGKVALLNKGTILNPDLIRVQEEVVRICGQESQFLSVAMDVHAWLNHYVKEYEAAVFLPQLLSVLTASTYEPGEEIAFAGMKAQDGHLQSFRAPLIWVLQGEVEHIHDPNNVVSVLAHDLRRLEFQSAAVAVGPRPGEVLETARATKGGLCAGPLGTVGSFFNGMHGTSTVVKAMSPKTMVATIQVENLNKLSGDTQFLLRNYCACKRWSHGTLSGRGLLSF